MYKTIRINFKLLNTLKRKNSSLPILRSLKYFDLEIVFGEYSINKDPKHVCKRIRGEIISQKIK